MYFGVFAASIILYDSDYDSAIEPKYCNFH